MTRAPHDREVTEEVRLHLELRVEQLMREGLDEASARAEARRRFAHDDQALDAVYDTARRRDRALRARHHWSSLLKDAGYAWRRLRREPLATAFMLMTLGLGLGANVTAFSLVDRLLLGGPEHVKAPQELARFYRRVTLPSIGDQTAPWIPWPTFEVLREGVRTATSLSAYRVDERLVGRGESARMRGVGRSTADLFTLLGVQPMLGRFFHPGELPTAGPVAIVSARFARGEDGGDPLEPGDRVFVADEPYTVIGVAPEGFTGPELRRVDVWTLVDPRAAGSLNWSVIGRRAPGVSLEVMAADADAVHRLHADRSPAWIRNASIVAAPIGASETAGESIESVMARWLALVSAAILLIACANVAGLLLARLARRQREMAIHVALGAGRARLTRLFLLEGLWLAFGAAVASLVVAAFAEPVIRRALFPDAGWTFSAVDPRVLGAVAAMAVVVGLLLGLIPALQAGNPRLTAMLRTGPRAGGGHRSRLRAALTVAQAALSVVLLIGAGLFLRSLERIASVDLGLDVDRIVTANALTPRSSAPVPDLARLDRERHRDLLDAVRRVPGVARAAASMGLPFNGGFGLDLHVPGLDVVPALPGGGPYFQAVSDDYFETMGTPLRSGRTFSSSDGEGSSPVLIASATMARALWPDEEPLGRCVHVGGPDAPCSRVVGVVADVHRSGIREEPSLQFYLPIGQERGIAGTSLVIRPSGRASDVYPAIRQAMLGVDPAITGVDLRLLSESLDEELRPLRIGAVTFGLSGALAMLVAALGLYGLMSYTVAWRTHEIGVRLAIGANPSQVMASVMRGGAVLAAAGTAIGLGLALTIRPWIEPQLFDTSARDPIVFGGVALTIMAVALAAGWWPARRAARISPTVALRAE